MILNSHLIVFLGGSEAKLGPMVNNGSVTSTGSKTGDPFYDKLSLSPSA